MRATEASWKIDAAAAPKPRPRSELLLRVLQPVATGGVRLLARLGVDPQAVVWTHSAVGLAAAIAIAAGGQASWWTAAALLQVKTLLDNMDGGLARATGRVTQMGRYLDTVLDTLVNAALFAALALHGPGPWAWPLAAVAYLLLVAMLSLDYNLERRYRALRVGVSDEGDHPPGASERWMAAFRGFYDAVLRPQDEAIARLDAAALERLRAAAGGTTPASGAPLVDRLAWNDLWSTATLVNLGLSTQLLVLGVCLALGEPFAYVLAVYLMAAYVVVIQALRVRRFRRHLAGA
jgi:archaetidylinositol phosphate synthase